MPSGWRRGAVGCGVLLLGAGALWWALRAAPQAGEAMHPDAVVKPAAPLPPVAAPAPAAAEVAPEPASAVDPAPEPPYDDHVALERYRELTRYPASSRRLTEESGDLLYPNRRYEKRQPLPGVDEDDEPGWEVRYTADRYFVRGAESLEITFALWREGKPVAPRRLELRAEPDRGAGGGAERLAVEREGDARRAEITPADHWPDHLGLVRVTASFSAPGLSEKSGSLVFYYTPESRIPAEFTGSFGDALVGGDLVVNVGVDVRVAGSYRVEGNLYDGTGAPVAWGRFEGELTPGLQRVPLVYFGLIFHDAAARPPFVLADVRGYRARPGDSPHREDMPSWPGRYTFGQRYVLSDFGRDEHDSAHKRAMLERYRDAIRRGVTFTVPRG